MEREIYDNVFDRAWIQYKALAAEGTITRNFSQIFSVLMRLRQAVCHPLLVLKGDKKGEEAYKTDSADSITDKDGDISRLVAEFQSGADSAGDGRANDAYTAQVLQNLLQERESDDDDEGECPICFETKTATCYIPLCMHSGCKECLLSYLQSCEDREEQPSCPTCRKGPVAAEDLIEAVRTRPRKNRIADAVMEADEEDEKGEGEGKSEGEELLPSSQHSEPAIFFRRNNFRTSTKLDALIEHLNRLRYEQPGFKGVIFVSALGGCYGAKSCELTMLPFWCLLQSQFTSFLDLVEVVLKRNRHPFVRLDGTVSQKDREAVLRSFNEAPKSMLMLISLRAGGVGLNCERCSLVRIDGTDAHT